MEGDPDSYLDNCGLEENENNETDGADPDEYNPDGQSEFRDRYVGPCRDYVRHITDRLRASKKGRGTDPLWQQIRKGNITIDPPSGYHTLLTDVLAGRLPTPSARKLWCGHRMSSTIILTRCIKDNCAGRTMAKGWPRRPKVDLRTKGALSVVCEMVGPSFMF